MPSDLALRPGNTYFWHVMYAPPLSPKQRWKQQYRNQRLEKQGKEPEMVFA